MKNLYLLLFITLLTAGTFAQQKPLYTQYVFNNYLLNPAITGIENYTDFKAGYRTQWAGIDGAPVTNYFSIHAPLGQGFLSGDANSFGGQENNPMSRSYLKNYMAAEPHHGIGIHGVMDKAGPFNKIDINVTYAYHLGITEKLNMSLGVAVGMSKIGLDLAKVSLDNTMDPAISGTIDNVMKPDVGAGLWIYGSRFFLGFSGQQLLGQTLNFSEGSSNKKGKVQPQYFLTAGGKISLSEDIAIMPSFLIRNTSTEPNIYNGNLKLAFKDKFWLGGSYRHGDSFSGLAGFNASKLVTMSYSYDFTTSNIANFSSGSHEIVLGLLLNNRYKVSGSQRNW